MNNLAFSRLTGKPLKSHMSPFRLQISVLVCLLLSISVAAQSRYQLSIRGVDKDSTFLQTQVGLQTSFVSKFACADYINKLPMLLQSKGYVTASVDSLFLDSTSAKMVLFVGQQYRWAAVDTRSIDAELLNAVGWRERNFTDKPMDFTQLNSWQERLLNQLENTGYPFSKVYLDSVQIEDEKISALLKVTKGPLYKFDSIRVYGNAKISNDYLQRYLEIANGSYYNKEKLNRISKKIRELTYVEEELPANLTMLGTGSVINLYLKQKKSSQINILIGFLPNNNQLASKKLLITGEGNLNLKNALGAGETIGLNFQALQVASQRLDLVYQHPYLFKSPVGVDFNLDILKKDSSFVNIQLQLGASYAVNANQSGKLFIQRHLTYISEGGIKPEQVIQTKQLPDVADVSSFNVGVEYELNTTDYRLNPRKGNEFRIITTIGSKKIKKNNEILDLKDPNNPAFDFDKLYDTVKLKASQFRARVMAARYLPLGNQRSTIKLALNGGILQSGNIFRNELFQIGGYKLLRGFDEESQYLSHFAISTVEYRYLVGQNSFFYVLADGGWGRNSSLNNATNYTYFGTGLGLAFETKAGIFNLAWAIGKRNDTEFNLRQSKIHFGFVNYF